MTRMLMGWMVAGLCLCTCLGCQTLSSTDFTSLWEDKGTIGKPTEVGAIWQDGVDVQLDAQRGGMPIPGFAGRIFFMQTKTGKFGNSVLVNGTLQVLLYDDRPQQNPAQPVPLETWTILPEHLEALVKKDITGWGYSIWLPWNTFDRSVQTVTMTVKYTGRDGTKLTGEPIQIHIRDANRGGMPRPTLDVKQVPVKTWQH